MMKASPSRWFAFAGAALLALFAFAAAAQDGRAGSTGEPTVAQIYQAANSGNLDRANAMVEEVIKTHPNSAKAHYVKAELSARGGKLDVARQELATAEKFAPGLPFAKPESVQALRNQLSQASANPAPAPATRQMGAPSVATRDAAPAPAPQRSFPWGTLIVVGAIVAIGAMMLRRRTAAVAAGTGYGGASGNSPAAPYGQTGYGPVYPPGATPQQPSMGSSLARGLGTGLAVGAGVVAAEEIGRRMFGHGHDARAAGYDPNMNTNTPSLDQIDEGMRRNLNTDMGGNDFGIADGGGSWDDGGGSFDGGGGGGGGDWDS